MGRHLGRQVKPRGKTRGLMYHLDHKDVADDSQPVTIVNVVYVAPSNAKIVKNILEKEAALSKRHRMVKVNTRPARYEDFGNGTSLGATFPQIALPLATPLATLLDKSFGTEEGVGVGQSWRKWILAHGQREMPLSTSQFASTR
jgi:hypothetical protein